MRLPYLQVTSETWLKARMLGAYLGVSRHHAIGIILDLWNWGLDLGPKDEPPNGIFDGPMARQMLVGVTEWRGDTDLLINALESLGLIEILSNYGLRVKGLDRYKRTWEKNRRKFCRKSAGKVPETGTNSAGKAPQDVDVDVDVDKKEEAVGDADAKTEIHQISDIGQDEPTTQTDLLALNDIQPKPEKKERKRSKQEKFAAWFEEQRVQKLGSEWSDDKLLAIQRINKEFEWISDCDEDIVLEAVELYFEDPKRRAQNPPCSLQWFARDRAEYLSKARRSVSA